MGPGINGRSRQSTSMKHVATGSSTTEEACKSGGRMRETKKDELLHDHNHDGIPMKVPAEQLRSVLGITDVRFKATMH